MGIPDWVGKYGNIPFKPMGRDFSGLDCWGLVRLVYEHELGLITPDYSEAYLNPFDYKKVPVAISHGLKEYRKVEFPKEFDLVILNVHGIPFHCGVVVNDSRFLHVCDNHVSATARIYDLCWRNRINGFYRHVSMP